MIVCPANGTLAHRVGTELDNDEFVCADCGGTFTKAEPSVAEREARVATLESALAHDRATLESERRYLADLEAALDSDDLRGRLEAGDDTAADSLAEHLGREAKERRFIIDGLEDRIIERERELDALRSTS